MKRQHRLNRRRQFRELRRVRIAATCGRLRVQAAPNGGLPCRAGFAVTGLRKAVDRNLVRRRLRALIQPRLIALAGIDVLIAAGPAAVAAPFGELGVDLDDCLTRVASRALSTRMVHRLGGLRADNGVAPISARPVALPAP